MALFGKAPGLKLFQMNVRLWHEQTLLNALTNIRLWGQTGQ
jgi:hypothetical protein